MNPPPPSSSVWNDLFPHGDYRFHMRFSKGDPAMFFGATTQREQILSERDHCLITQPGRHAGLLPEGHEVWNEFRRMATAWAPGGSPEQAGTDPSATDCACWGRVLEPDFLLLQPSGTGRFRLVGGCVCFPSSWSFPEKLGLQVEEIHEIVPGLNAQIGSAIGTFLHRMTPGPAWLRSNWGLSRSPDLNQDPIRGLPRLEAHTPPEETFLRIEHQALIRLPQCGGVLFGIRLEIHPLAEAVRRFDLQAGLLRALETMPEEMARYKGLTPFRPFLMRWLQAFRP